MLVFNWFSFATRLVIEFTSNVSTSACAHTAPGPPDSIPRAQEMDQGRDGSLGGGGS
jgi:hypothetical protein